MWFTRWRCAATAVAITVTLPLVSCGTIGPEDSTSAPPESTAPPAATPGNSYEAIRTEGLNALLAEWADAQRTGDPEALTRLFHPDADPDFVESERRKAVHLDDVPLREWRYELTSAPEIFVPAEIADRIDARDVWAPSLQLVYQLTADHAATSLPVGLIVARVGDEWLLVSDSDVTTDARTWRGPWDFGPVITETVTWQGAESLVLGHPGDQDVVSDTVAELEEALEDVDRFWRSEWEGRVVVFVSQTEEEFSALTGGAHDNASAAAVAIADPERDSSGAATGQRIVLSAPVMRTLPDEARAVVLRHELSHVVTRPKTGQSSPLWLLEGTAEYAGRATAGVTLHEGASMVRALVRQFGPPDTLPRDDHFQAGGETSALAYELAWTFSVYLAETFGEAELPRVYYALAAPGAGPAVLEDRMRETTGRGLAETVREWGAWLEREFA
ncbi:hypothetical protein [Hoyosella subflava]|uniref:Peptidase MA-like domain-containing protein n=1 Tax=Hoyosella subflava (strain DSM 45089 / JCM 17490 / NBRC 109087 / DQS3-9A1) TaxID=443218 RepID=F6EFC9_HOYSD|nr:hypothetical protein [Hoyosella subflava]AEF39742.1 hypothetical protein AS9A_1290 [Hoyosella subflava DQS3-9A1]